MYYWDKKDLTEEYINKHRINLIGHITSFRFYNFFLKDLFDYVQENANEEEPPVLSITKMEWIDSNVLPLLISVGLVMKRFYKKPIPIEMIYEPRIIAYLDTTLFFFYGKHLQIFDFDEEYVGGYNETYHFNDNYRLMKNPALYGYYEKADVERLEMKYLVQDQLEKIDIRRVFGPLLAKTMVKDSIEFEDSLREIAEIVSNAQLYSEDVSFVCVQALKKGISISISDTGIGITGSLKKKGELFDKEIMEEMNVKSEESASEALTDFLGLFTVLKKSESDKRTINLWGLKRHVTQHQGTMRIHTNRIQVLFTSGKCGKCQKNSSIMCMRCILKRFSSDYSISPLRIYREKFKGVHIEIDFVGDDKGNEFIN